VLRSASRLTCRVIIAAVLATGCSGPPVVVEERMVPAVDRPTKLTSKAPQPTKPALQPASVRIEGTDPLLLYWEIRKEGK
jgi:hypothetical protein